MSERPVLYSFRRCPYAMRARLAIAVAGTPVELREVVLRDKPSEMVEASPKGTVPVLITDCTVIDESLDVMRWALSQHDPDGWLTSADDPLIAENDGPFKHHLDRYKYATRYDDADPEEHRAAGFQFLEKLAARLDGASYLASDRAGFADIAIFPFVRQFRIADPGWFDENAPAPVRAWLKRLCDAAQFKSVMKKYPPWKDTGEAFAFPDAPQTD